MTVPEMRLLLQDRLNEIARIIEAVDARCLVNDGSVAKFQDEVTDRELRRIYTLASGTSKRRKL